MSRSPNSVAAAVAADEKVKVPLLVDETVVVPVLLPSITASWWTPPMAEDVARAPKALPSPGPVAPVALATDWMVRLPLFRKVPLTLV